VSVETSTHFVEGPGPRDPSARGAAPKDFARGGLYRAGPVPVAGSRSGVELPTPRREKRSAVRFRRVSAWTLGWLCTGLALAATEEPGLTLGVVGAAGLAVPAPSRGRRLAVLSLLEPSRLCAPGEVAVLDGSEARVWLLGRPAREDEPCWLAGLATLAAARSHRGATYLVADDLDGPADGLSFAHLVKRAAIALRGADSSAVVVAGPPGDGVDARWFEAFASAGPSPYLDALAATPAAFPAVLQARERSFPGVGVWLVEREEPSEPRPDALLRVAVALARGAAAVFVHAYAAEEVRELAAFLDALPPDVQATSAPPHDRARSPGPVLKLLGGPGGRQRLFVMSPHDETVALRLAPPTVERAEVLDVLTGDRRPAELNRGSRGTAVAWLPPAPHVTLVSVQPSDASVGETVAVATHVGLTAEEIIARERESRARQEMRLETFRAAARVSYHFTLASLGESVDVVTDNDAFGSGDAIEYRELEMYVNGALWRGSAPKFPFVAPEQIKEIPLQLTLHEGYDYRLAGEEEERGRPCYRIAFEPRTPQADFRGTVWIDAREFFRVRLDLVRLHATAPVTSDALTQWFEPVETPAGPFWLMTSLRGQMTFSALGEEAAIERTILFDDFRVNPPAFEEQRREALSSKDPMYRDSLAEGLVALEPLGPGGERAAVQASQTSNTLLIAGMGAGVDGDVALPFAGINWFDMDFRHSGTQMDLLWAGPFAGLSVTWPRIAPRWEATLQVRAAAIGEKSRYSDATGRNPEQDASILTERVQGYFRRGLTPGLAVIFNPSLTFQGFSPEDGTRADYVLPPDTWIPGLGVEGVYQKRGYRIALFAEAEHRLDWAPFGLPEEIAAGPPPRSTPVRYGAQIGKNFYAHGQERFWIDLSFLDGSDLDRYSRYRFHETDGLRLRGYNASGLQFDRGALAEMAYAFRLGGAVQVELLLGSGLLQSEENYGPGWEHATGAGLSLSFAGPAGTFFRIRGSQGLESSLPIDGDRGTLRVTVIKSFGGWWPASRQRRRSAAVQHALADDQAAEERLQGGR